MFFRYIFETFLVVMANIPLPPYHAERKEKVYNPRTDFFEDLDDSEFRKRFRLSKTAFQYLLELLRDDLSSDTGKGGDKNNSQGHDKGCFHFCGYRECRTDPQDLHTDGVILKNWTEESLFIDTHRYPSGAVRSVVRSRFRRARI